MHTKINKFIIDGIVSEREIMLNKNLIMPFSNLYIITELVFIIIILYHIIKNPSAQ
jgi:hypothetical protein